jgi:hypothetical protein
MVDLVACNVYNNVEPLGSEEGGVISKDEACKITD